MNELFPNIQERLCIELNDNDKKKKKNVITYYKAGYILYQEGFRTRVEDNYHLRVLEDKGGR